MTTVVDAEDPAELAQSSGSRLAVCVELDKGQRYAETRVTQLTGRNYCPRQFIRRDLLGLNP